MRSESKLDGKQMMIFRWRQGLIFIHNAKEQWGTRWMGRNTTHLTHEVSRVFLQLQVNSWELLRLIGIHFWIPEHFSLRLGVMVAACRSFNKVHPNVEGELKLCSSQHVPNIFPTFNRNWLWSKNIVFVVPFLDIAWVKWAGMLISRNIHKYENKGKEIGIFMYIPNNCFKSRFGNSYFLMDNTNNNDWHIHEILSWV